MQWLAIVFLSILACVTYGIIHDQFTARICIEYFTIGHQRILQTEDPTITGIVWGVIATWWIGVILGIPLATAARFGPRPKRSLRSLYKPLAILMFASAILACCSGIVGYVAASNNWIRLVGRFAEEVPKQKHIPFLVDLWVHNASYLGGFVGGTIIIVRTWRSRGPAANKENV